MRMTRMIEVAAAVVVGLIGSGCTHKVTLNAPAPLAVEAVALAGTVVVPPSTAEKVENVKSAAAGLANTWQLQTGKAVVDYAHAYADPLFTPGADRTLTIELEQFEIKGFAATAVLHFKVAKGGGVTFEKSYTGKGNSSATKALLLGAAAFKSALTKTTDQALQQAFLAFREDAKAQSKTW